METKITGDKLTATWTTADVAKVAEAQGVKLTTAEKKSILKGVADVLKKCNDVLIAQCLPQKEATNDNTANTEPWGAPIDPAACKWYYHSSSSKNETKDAIAAALDNNVPMLLMACKPACDVCKLVWQNLKATSKFADYLKAKGIVAIKIEDTANHFTDLAKAKNAYTGIDGIKGNKINSTAPFFVFFKMKDSARGRSQITLADTQIDVYFSGFGNAKSAAKTYDTVTAWLDSIMNMSAYKKAF